MHVTGYVTVTLNSGEIRGLAWLGTKLHAKEHKQEIMST